MRRSLVGILTALCLLWGAPTGAQEISKSIGTASTSYILDGQPAPTRAYSLRRLLTSYSTNKLINIVRASDSTVSDIGFDATGALDVATATTFCNATTCKVVTIYDQSGNTVNLTQGTDANRPNLVFSCLGAYPCAQATVNTQTLSAASFTPATGVASLAVVYNRAVGTGACAMLRENGTNNRMEGSSANIWRTVGGTSGQINRAATDAVWANALAVINGASSSMRVGSAATGTGTLTGNTTAGTSNTAGVASTTCQYVELMFFDNVALAATQSDAITAGTRAWWFLP